jgi:hypothetical protein
MDEPDEGAPAETRTEDESAEQSDSAPAPGRHLAEGTGHPAVDAVLASLEGLEAMPVHEHVAVFESAHESLRRSLDEAGSGAGDEPGAGEPGSGEQGQG